MWSKSVYVCDPTNAKDKGIKQRWINDKDIASK